MIESLMHALADAAVLPPIACAGILLAVMPYPGLLHRREDESGRQS
ncbi:MAG: hypothetical protein OXD44_08680 [Gammaproteobacteria bacterium]|nr:hypothetical protein [Gammaproteobacteria bacterium]MCY4313750.1 hypothetical protein [Gammaproteobacteria bacterium]